MLPEERNAILIEHMPMLEIIAKKATKQYKFFQHWHEALSEACLIALGVIGRYDKSRGDLDRFLAASVCRRLRTVAAREFEKSKKIDDVDVLTVLDKSILTRPDEFDLLSIVVESDTFDGEAKYLIARSFELSGVVGRIGILADELGVSEETVRRRLRDLEKHVERLVNV